MKDELIMLNKKIKFILEEKELPETIKEKIEEIYQEYRVFYNEYLKNDMSIASQGVASRNVEEYFEANYLEAMSKIQSKYKEKCLEKAEVVTIVLSTLESQDEQVQKLEIDILDKCVKNGKENYLYADNFINIIIDSIKDSKNQLFRTLDSLGTTDKKMEYINSRIKLIENSAKLNTTYIKEELDIDNEQISRQVFSEYEQYKQNEESNKKEEQSAHQKFVNEYKVSQEDLRIIEKTEEDSNKSKEQEYEELPGDIIL